MADTLTINLESRESEKLQRLVQEELARRRWSEGEDDAVMSEYILVMVANKKTPEQIVQELKELVGDAQMVEGNSSDAGVESFVAWLWSKGHEMISESAMGEAKKGPERVFRRRSASPASRQEAGDHYRTEGSSRQQNGKWNESDTRAQTKTRELFDTDRNSDRPLRMDNHAKGPKRAAQDRNGTFRRSMEEAYRSNASHSSSKSILTRTGVPNPYASEFVPRSDPLTETAPTGTAQSLLYRLDPMMPDNSQDNNHQVQAPPAEYPTKPQEESLCRWGLKCTSPTCVYSHPSPSAVTRLKQTGEEPLVLRSDPCHYQSDCSKPDCEFSHISPAVKFVIAKATRAATLAFGVNTTDYADGVASDQQRSMAERSNASRSSTPIGVPCRYGAGCYRQDCHFQHPAERSAHISDRLRSFNDTADEGEMETIIPVA